MHKISVVIRNKNQDKSLEFLLMNLEQRYKDDIDETIVIDNQSTDNSLEIITKYNVKLVTINNFSYGGSANLAAESSSNNIIVIFSAHAYPVSHDFFKQIKLKFESNSNLAGVRCLHNPNDYRNYINKVSSTNDGNMSGLIFCGSAFSKKVWEKHSFKSDIQTFEDKEWTKRVLKAGYEIEFSPSIFAYQIKRTPKQLYIRYKNEIVGSYQLWHREYTFTKALKNLLISILSILRKSIIDSYFSFRRFFFMLNFLINKPNRFD